MSIRERIENAIAAILDAEFKKLEAEEIEKENEKNNQKNFSEPI